MGRVFSKTECQRGELSREKSPKACHLRILSSLSLYTKLGMNKVKDSMKLKKEEL